MKNVVDVVLGGVSYWAIGYGLSYGSDTVNLISITILFKSRKEKHEVWVTAILEQWLTLCFVFVDKHEYQKYNKVELYISRGRQRSMAWDPGSLTILVLWLDPLSPHSFFRWMEGSKILFESNILLFFLRCLLQQQQPPLYLELLRKGSISIFAIFKISLHIPWKQFLELFIVFIVVYYYIYRNRVS